MIYKGILYFFACPENSLDNMLGDISAMVRILHYLVSGDTNMPNLFYHAVYIHDAHLGLTLNETCCYICINRDVIN